MPALIAMIKNKKAPGLVITPSSVNYVYTNSPPSATPGTLTIYSDLVTVSGGSGSYFWELISGNDAVAQGSAFGNAASWLVIEAQIGITYIATFRAYDFADFNLAGDITISMTYLSGL